MSHKILIVDDQESVVRMLGYLLERNGYKVSIAETGTDALNQIKAELPDLVILDVMMSDMSGFEVCKQLRKRSETIRLPIIMFSALSDSKNKNEGFEAGADEYLVKTIEPKEFLSRVASLLQRSQALNQTIKTAGTVLAFMGAKGGVGTTSVVLNVATALVGQKKSVVVAEIRPTHGTLSTQLNIEQPESGLTSLLDIDPGQIDEREVSQHLTRLPSGLNLLVGPQRVADFREIAPQQVTKIINTIASMFDYVILDLPYQFPDANQEAIRHCDLVALVVEPEPSSLAAGIVAIEQINSWGMHRDHIKMIIVNRSNLAQPIPIEQLRTGLRHEIIGVVPPAADAFIAAQRVGVPVFLLQPNSDTAKAMDEIAKQISASNL